MPKETSQQWPHEEMVELLDVLGEIDQLDEPEKVVVPRFVVDFIEEVKTDKSLRVAFEYIAQRKRDNYEDEPALKGGRRK